MIKYNLKQILEDKTLPPEPIIDNGILLDKTMLFIVGPAKSKKTFLTQNFALSIAMGDDFAGFKIPKTMIFQQLSKTSTGKIRKNLLREKALKLS